MSRPFDGFKFDFLLFFNQPQLRKVISRLKAQPHLVKRIAISGETPLLPLTRLLSACRVTPRAFAVAVMVRPSSSML
jgi:hypothetical protein